MQEPLRGCSDTLRTALTTTTGYRAMTTATTARGKSVSTNLVWERWCGLIAHCGERTVIDMRLLYGFVAGALWVMLMVYAIGKTGVEIPEYVQWLSTVIIVAGAMAGGD